MGPHEFDFSLPHRNVPPTEEQFKTKLVLQPQGAQLNVSVAITRHLGENQSECTRTFTIDLDQVVSDDHTTLVRHIPLIIKGLRRLNARDIADTLKRDEIDRLEVRVTDVITDMAFFLRRQLPPGETSGKETLRRATPYSLPSAEEAEAAK